MKIELNNISKEKAVTKIGEFTISNTLTFRYLNNNNEIILKLRNSEYDKSGRILKLENIQSINQLNIDGEIYNNLIYKSHEIYIHTPIDNERVADISLVEDLNITFEKVETDGK